MSNAISVTIKTDAKQAVSDLKHFESIASNTLPLMKIWSVAIAKMASANARAKGGRHFWQDIAKNCRTRSVTETSAEVYSDKPGASLRQFGGTIVPVKAKALTIPISPEAEGKTAREFSAGGKALFKIKGNGGNGILAYADSHGQLHALFALRTRVYQKPDPWWPNDEEIANIGLAEAQRMIDKAMLRAGGAS